MTVLSNNAKKIITDRYLIEDVETEWEDCTRRVGRELSSVEKDRKKYEDGFAEIINDLLFIPAGRILRNAGRQRGSLFNCYNVPIGDSREAIGEFYKHSLMLWGEGGGIGSNFSFLRPKGAKISGVGGYSSGPVSFLKASDAIANTIESGGSRRAAALALMLISHPDIEEFIDAKLVDKILSHYNISVGVTEDFLIAVQKNEDWNLTFAQQVYKTVNAKDLWYKIIDNMVNSAEPGLINWDNFKTNNSYYVELPTCCNPCQPSWATVLTPKGISTIGNISVGDTIWSEDGWVKVTNKVYTGGKGVFEYRTTAGVFYGTRSHRVVANGEKIEAENAESIDILLGKETDIEKLDTQIIMDGLVLGDGSVHKASNNLVYLIIGNNDQDYFNSEISSLIGKHRPGIKEKCYEINTFINYKELPKTYNRVVPERYKKDFATIKAFLRGMYSANGSVLEKYNRITYKTASYQIVEDLQIMLSSLGIKSYFTENKPTTVKFYNGEYTCKRSYDINITDLQSLKLFYYNIGFIQEYKNNKLLFILNSKTESKKKNINYSIKHKKFLGKMDVYDITVDGPHHTYWSGGCNVSNCGEAVLESYGSCDLGSLVLPNFISGVNTNWKKMEQTIELAVRMLDNAIDINKYVLQEIDQKAHALRRIGIGYIGLAEYLFAKKLRYGSVKGLLETERVAKFVRDKVYETLVKLSIEKGSFPKFDPVMYGKARFIRTLPASLRTDIKKYGTRCCTAINIAPTGTISLIPEYTSSIEPLPFKAYRRSDRLGDRIYIHKLYKEVLKSNEDSSEWFVDTTDLEPKDHLETQAVVQRYSDGAVSKTINLPKGTDRETLSELLLEYIFDVKGVTVYVDGSREGQILNSITKEEALKYLEESETVVSETTCASGKCEL